MTDPQQKIHICALNLLARREHTETELFQKLRMKGFPLNEIKIVIKNLADKGLISHTRFIENYVQSRMRKGYGPLRIRLELIERGLHEDFIEHHINMADNAWFALIRAVWQKRFKGQQPCDFKTRAQQMRFLNYRGFTQEQIESIYASDE